MKKLLYIIFILIFIGLSNWVIAATYDDAFEEKTITAQNTFTDPIRAVPREGGEGRLNISIVGTAFSGTVTLQRQYLNADVFTDTWLDVYTWTADKEDFLTEKSREVIYRIGVKTGEFAGTSVKVRLSK
jgi:stress-induced morphogen